MSNEALTGLFGAYGSDEDEGLGSDDGAGKISGSAREVILQRKIPFLYGQAERQVFLNSYSSQMSAGDVLRRFVLSSAAGTGAGVVLLEGDAEMQEGEEKEDSGEEVDLSALLTPSRLPEVQSMSQLAFLPGNIGGSLPDGQPGDAAARSGGVASTSKETNRPQLPPELAERPPGEVDPQMKVRNNLLFGIYIIIMISHILVCLAKG